jgi:hypothetical protein
VPSAIDQRKLLTFRARTYMAFVVTPRTPIADWLIELDASLERRKGFFSGHPVALDLSAVQLRAEGIAELVASLHERNMRVLGIEGVEIADPAAKLPPQLRSGHGQNTVQPAYPAPRSKAPAPPAPQRPASLLIENPVRSGQSVVFTDGDVTVLGSVASGAEIIPAARSMCTAHCAARPWPAPRTILALGFFATASKPNSWPSVAITRPRTKSTTTCAAARSRLGSTALR